MYIVRVIQLVWSGQYVYCHFFHYMEWPRLLYVDKVKVLTGWTMHSVLSNAIDIDFVSFNYMYVHVCKYALKACLPALMRVFWLKHMLYSILLIISLHTFNIPAL